MTTLFAGYWKHPYYRSVMLNPSGAFPSLVTGAEVG